MNPEGSNSISFGSHSRTDPIYRLLKLAKSKLPGNRGIAEEDIEMKSGGRKVNSTPWSRRKSMCRLVKCTKTEVNSKNTTTNSVPSSSPKNERDIPEKLSNEAKINPKNGDATSLSSKKPCFIRRVLNYAKSKLSCGSTSQFKNSTSVQNKLDSLVCQRKLYVHLIISLRDLAVSLHSTAELDVVTAEMMYNHLTSLYNSYLSNETVISSMYHGNSCFDNLLEDVEEMQQKVFFLQVSLKKIMLNKSTSAEINNHSNSQSRRSRSKGALNLHAEQGNLSSEESESESESEEIDTLCKKFPNSFLVDCVVEVNSRMANNNVSTEQIDMPDGRESSDELSDGFEVIPPDSISKKVESIPLNNDAAISSEIVQQNLSSEKIEENISIDKSDVHKALQFIDLTNEPIELADESYFE